MARAARPEGALLRVRVQPRARRNEIQGWRDAALRVRVTAPPTGGEANRAVADLLADAFRVPPSSVELVSGGTARDKLFRVGSLSVDQLRARLEDARR
jgi:uncharacterized protein (TIGR00251 family)